MSRKFSKTSGFNKKGQFDLFYDQNTVIEVCVQFKQKLQSNQLL